MSAVPAAIDGLIAAVKLALPDLAGAVFDGPPRSWPDQDFIVVGFAADIGRAENQADIYVETTQTGLGAQDYETISVNGMIQCVSGDFEVKTTRDRAYGFYETIAARLQQDQTLGGAVLKARPSVVSTTQARNESGAVLLLTFSVSCLAFA